MGVIIVCGNRSNASYLSVLHAFEMCFKVRVQSEI
jgi:hypothetical protein